MDLGYVTLGHRYAAASLLRVVRRCMRWRPSLELVITAVAVVTAVAVGLAVGYLL